MRYSLIGRAVAFEATGCRFESCYLSTMSFGVIGNTPDFSSGYGNASVGSNPTGTTNDGV